ncbi:MAG: hydrogenase expression/formation protein HypE [Gammaproteobacteria bacterium]|nr:hydrogenase expression/formation protein HypE [Gammaproteobacteria bacterium]MBT8150212.1 hydrogenase expression/formation protein HypE [Gammaproteobacteria bacterium]NNM10288.1 hydrogenase expression/formation protein HypE [Pseudomonadales bacterium]
MKQFSCPVEIDSNQIITLAHGSGGRLTRQLIEDVIKPALANVRLDPLEDAAILQQFEQTAVMTTDSYVISPIQFPGGDIGKLAICGTVNDLAMMGATPLYLSLGFILEEGLHIAELAAVVQSISQTAQAAGVAIVTGDTKVVEKGKGDKIFINTSGIGARENTCKIGTAEIRSGDKVIVSGDIGRHGVAVMAARDPQAFDTPVISDIACLNHVVTALIEEGIAIHCMRDLTRGGLATACIELAQSSALQFDLGETTIPVEEAVQSVCDVLGLDPLYIANEGRFVLIIPETCVERALAVFARFDNCKAAKVIGEVTEDKPGWATLRNAYGVSRKLDLLAGDQLPRIC